LDVEVRPLGPTNLSALERLFVEGGDPSWCFCMSFRIPQSGDRASRRDLNRAALEELVESSALPAGLVAMSGDRAVGWVSLAPREDYPRLGRSPVYAPVDDAPVWSIVCFVVAKDQRGKGMMRRLLEAAVDHARSHAASWLEAYPPDTGDERVGAAYGYAGFKSLYERAGFEVVAARAHTPGATPRLIMRLDLTTPQSEAKTETRSS
jgi:GNAT superfamily N-acetyltransferase